MTEIAPLILWAEDNAQDRFFIEESLADLDAQGVALVSDGIFLLEALGRGRPGLVVLDLKMPRLGGIETLRKIRGHPEWMTLPVVIFSSGERPAEIAQCRALGVDEIVQKPLDFDGFTSAVQRIVRSAVVASTA